jgi:hypothetical protein
LHAFQTLKKSALPKYFFVEHKLVGGADGSGEGSRLHGITQRIAPAHKHSNSSIFQLPVDVPASASASNLVAQVRKNHLNMVSNCGRPGLTDTPSGAKALACSTLPALAPVQKSVTARRPFAGEWAPESSTVLSWGFGNWPDADNEALPLSVGLISCRATNYTAKTSQLKQQGQSQSIKTHPSLPVINQDGAGLHEGREVGLARQATPPRHVVEAAADAIEQRYIVAGANAALPRGAIFRVPILVFLVQKILQD